MNRKFCCTASAVPKYQSDEVRPLYGVWMLTPPVKFLFKSQGPPAAMCSINEWGLYWARINISKMSEFTQFDNVKSMMRYFPAKGTAGLVRFAVNTPRRDPSPPARITARTRYDISPSPSYSENFERSIKQALSIKEVISFDCQKIQLVISLKATPCFVAGFGFLSVILPDFAACQSRRCISEMLYRQGIIPINNSTEALFQKRNLKEYNKTDEPTLQTT